MVSLCHFAEGVCKGIYIFTRWMKHKSWIKREYLIVSIWSTWTLQFFALTYNHLDPVPQPHWIFWGLFFTPHSYAARCTPPQYAYRDSWLGFSILMLIFGYWFVVVSVYVCSIIRRSPTGSAIGLPIELEGPELFCLENLLDIRIRILSMWTCSWRCVSGD